MVHECQKLIKVRWLCVQRKSSMSSVDMISVLYAFKNSLHVLSNSANLVISANLHPVVLQEKYGGDCKKTNISKVNFT